jgi:hypothetical protein
MPRAALWVFTKKEELYEKNSLDSFVAAVRLFCGDRSDHKQLKFEHEVQCCESPPETNL